MIDRLESEYGSDSNPKPGMWLVEPVGGGIEGRKMDDYNSACKDELWATNCAFPAKRHLANITLAAILYLPSLARRSGSSTKKEANVLMLTSFFLIAPLLKIY